jgi:hypothetical protein
MVLHPDSVSLARQPCDTGGRSSGSRPAVAVWLIDRGLRSRFGRDLSAPLDNGSGPRQQPACYREEAHH